MGGTNIRLVKMQKWIIAGPPFATSLDVLMECPLTSFTPESKCYRVSLDYLRGWGGGCWGEGVIWAMRKRNGVSGMSSLRNLGLFWWRIWCRGATTTPYHSCQTSATMMQWGLVVDVEAAHSSVFHPPAPGGDHIQEDKLWAAEDLSWGACWVLAELTTSESLKKEMMMIGRDKNIDTNPFSFMSTLFHIPAQNCIK